MKKIPTLFLRDEINRRYVTRDINPVCLWVIDGQGVPTMKWDGTAVLIDDDGNVWKRREVKAGREPPDGFRHEETDETTGKSVGWVRARLDAPDDRWLAEAVHAWHESVIPPGTYELVGPKVQGNPHSFSACHLLPHGGKILIDMGRDYDTLVASFRHAQQTTNGFEGVVWHHPDGRMAKLKAKDLRELAG